MKLKYTPYKNKQNEKEKIQWRPLFILCSPWNPPKYHSVRGHAKISSSFFYKKKNSVNFWLISCSLHVFDFIIQSFNCTISFFLLGCFIHSNYFYRFILFFSFILDYILIVEQIVKIRYLQKEKKKLLSLLLIIFLIFN